MGDRFGTIFLDLKTEFLAYGDFIRQFKYTIDILDQLDVGEIDRPRLKQFLIERAADNVGFKALVTKPLNQIASYELGLREMADATSSEDPDFKILMNALSIMYETNKHINKCLNQSYHTAAIKKLEKRISFKSNKDQPDLERTYNTHVGTAQYIEEFPVELILKRGVKKRASGTIFLFDKMIMLCSTQRNAQNKTKRIFVIPEVNADILTGNLVQFIPLVKMKTGDWKEMTNAAMRVRCDTQMRCKDILTRLEQLKEACQANRVFGLELNELLEREENDSGVPFVVHTLCSFLMKHLDTVGLFRVPGSAQVEKTVRTAFNDQGGNVNLDDFGLTPSDAAGLLKLFFRELPAPLCGDLFIKFVQSQKNYTEEQLDQMLEELHQLVKKLSINNRKTLKYVCIFMYQVAQHKDINKMDCSNVAMCIGPDLMKPPVDSIELALMVPQANEALARMVELHEEIFTNI